MYFFLLINPVQKWSKDPMQKYIWLNLKKEEERGKKPMFYILTVCQRSLRAGIALCVVVVLCVWFEMHEEAPNPVCRHLRVYTVSG